MKANHAEYNIRNFRDYRNNLNTLIKKAKQYYQKNKIESNKGNVKIWECVKKLTGQKGKGTEISEINASNGIIKEASKILVANEFCGFFMNTGK